MSADSPRMGGPTAAPRRLAVSPVVTWQRNAVRILELLGHDVGWNPLGAEAIAAWGRKVSGRRAALVASLLRKPLVTLEDGFLRSVGLGVHKAPLLSLIVDPVGIYYDATRPSRLEQLIESHASFPHELLGRALAGRAAVRRGRITKYNVARQPLPPELGGRDFVLLVDQTVGDASVRLGHASEASFGEMLAAARQRFPESLIVIKTHPDVSAGKKRGFLTRGVPGAIVLADAVDPWRLLEAARAVFTVTSMLGFEALLAEREVHTFGMPFYAGWGLTIDAQTLARRTARPSLDALFAAAYLSYPVYYDPLDDRLASFEEVLPMLSGSAGADFPAAG